MSLTTYITNKQKRYGPAAKVLLLSIFPEEYHDRLLEKPLDAKTLRELLTEIYSKYPDKYASIVDRLMALSRAIFYQKQVFSPKIEDFDLPANYIQLLDKMKLKQQELYKKYANKPEQLATELEKFGLQVIEETQKQLLSDEKLKNNAFVLQMKSGARGNPSQLMGLLFSDVLYSDNTGKTIPILINRRFIQGLLPHQIWAGSYGARYGLYFLQHGTRVAGAINKQLIQKTHDLIVTSVDSDNFYKYFIGYPVSTDDADAVGSILAQKADKIPQNVLITPDILAYLRQKGIKRILIRSPIVSITKDGQLAAYDVGIRERGTLPAVGDFVGIIASQAITEPLTQAQLSAKHTGGIKGSGKASDFLQQIEAFFEPSEASGIMAVHADEDGVIKSIEDLPFGGKKIVIKTKDKDIEYYAATDDVILVKKGDKVEAGDMIIEGVPDLSKTVEHKGIGEGRRLFINYLHDLLKKAGISVHKKNLELLATGIINQVMVTEKLGRFYPGDIVSYNKIAYYYIPRKTAKRLPVDSSLVGKYLEEPVINYSIGTKLKPSMIETMKEFGVKNVLVHDEPPPFKPVYIRLTDQLEKSEDWMVRQLGQHLERGLMDALRRGLSSKFIENTSFVPSLAKGIDFGYVPYSIGATEEDIKKIREETERLRERSKKYI